VGTKEDIVTGELIIEKVKKGETAAVETYNKFLEHIVTGLVSITHILDPGLIIIGGGISAAGDFFFQDINTRFQQQVMPSFARYTKIVRASLENDAGLIGACYCAFELA
jgi:glucokinase